MYRVDALKDIKADIKATLKQSDLVTMDTLKNLPLKTKIIGVVVKLIAPLL